MSFWMSSHHGPIRTTRMPWAGDRRDVGPALVGRDREEVVIAGELRVDADGVGRHPWGEGGRGGRRLLRLRGRGSDREARECERGQHHGERRAPLDRHRFPHAGPRDWHATSSIGELSVIGQGVEGARGQVAGPALMEPSGDVVDLILVLGLGDAWRRRRTRSSSSPHGRRRSRSAAPCAACRPGGTWRRRRPSPPFPHSGCRCPSRTRRTPSSVSGEMP